MTERRIVFFFFFLVLGCAEESSGASSSRDRGNKLDGDMANATGGTNDSAENQGSAGTGGDIDASSSIAGGGGESDASSGSAGSSGSIAAGGTGGASGGAAGSTGEEDASVNDAGGAMVCGSRGSAPCADGEFCDYIAGSNCGADDRGGQCKTKPSACDFIYMPVCGCDGQTYGNECAANAAGVSVDYEGECANVAADNDCDPRKVLCKMATPNCPFGQVPSVLGSCYGPCVPVDSCVCSSPEQCPDSSQYTCHISAGHCGPYV
jgi:hypothetical protein